ncbi:unnamed protein product, partial [marine sediment metagenome]
PARKVIRFEIENKVVHYFDEVWKSGVQVMPLDKHVITKMRRSGNKNIQVMAALILDANKGQDLKDYNSCKTDEDVAEMIRKDCKSKGLIE